MWDKVIYTLHTTQPTWFKNNLKTEKYKELYLLRVRKSMAAILGRVRITVTCLLYKLMCLEGW